MLMRDGSCDPVRWTLYRSLLGHRVYITKVTLESLRPQKVSRGYSDIGKRVRRMEEQCSREMDRLEERRRLISGFEWNWKG